MKRAALACTLLFASETMVFGQAGQAVPPAAKGQDNAPQRPDIGATVIKPPAQVDPGIRAPTPSSRQFPMPVIKPPPAQVAPQAVPRQK
jgi:hypothetical protein